VTRHVFRLVWNRKRSTGLIMVEILICFLVLCGLMAAVLNLGGRYCRPLGFHFENVWTAEVTGMNWRAEGEELAADRRTMAELLRALEGMPEVEAASVTTNLPYSGSTWAQDTWIDSRREDFLWTLSTPGLPRALELRLLHGRWLEDADVPLGYRPVVISENLARDQFGTEDPVGQVFPEFDRQGEPTEPKEGEKINRVVGVCADFRRSGEFHDADYTMLVPADLTAGEELPTNFVIRVRPGTTAAFEERLVRTMLDIAPRWSVDTALMEHTRRGWNREFLVPLLISLVVALFLIVMVGLGLVGVLWLSVTRRTAELGLRRAVGASAVSVRRQILGELWALTTLAVLTGAAIFLQFPLFGANFGASWPVFLGGLSLGTLVIFGFVTFCGLYPTWLATRIQPATALQYE
jgi:putative ABC transport system permease protein